MTDHSDRYQNQPWYIKLWRRRHYLAIPRHAWSIYWSDRRGVDDRWSLTWADCWSIAVGSAQARMNWLYCWQCDECGAAL